MKMKKVLIGLVFLGLCFGYLSTDKFYAKPTAGGAIKTATVVIDGTNGSISANGTIRGSIFYGDGSGMTNVPVTTTNIVLTGNITASSALFNGQVTANGSMSAYNFVATRNNKVINGDFSSGTTANWSVQACTLSIVAGNLRITDEDGGINNTYQVITGFVVGEQYIAAMDIKTDAITGGMSLMMGTSVGATTWGNATLASGTGNVTFVFTPTATSGYLTLRNSAASAGEYWDVNNVTVYRYYNIKGYNASFEGFVSANALVSNATMNYNVVTQNAVLTTGNINIPVRVNGVTYYLKANTGL